MDLVTFAIMSLSTLGFIVALPPCVLALLRYRHGRSRAAVGGAVVTTRASGWLYKTMVFERWNDINPVQTAEDFARRTFPDIRSGAESFGYKSVRLDINGATYRTFVV